VGVAVCAEALIKTAKKREAASDQGISRFVIQRSIENLVQKKSVACSFVPEDRR
jgi:hypothetical protein